VESAPSRAKAAPAEATPEVAPAKNAKPTAICKDGSLSYSKQHSGACSHHGGVTQWY
jgi:hypothetical protein